VRWIGCSTVSGVTRPPLEATAPRMLPPLSDVNRAFWTGGRDGRLLIQRCARCDRWVHPPRKTCATCGGALAAEPVTGRGRVFTFTINMHAFHPRVPPPYVIAVVQLDEQDDLRVPTNIVGCDPSAVTVGAPVRVVFERNGDVYVPLFELA
jgi:uncharacterized OB-fold protein